MNDSVAVIWYDRYILKGVENMSELQDYQIMSTGLTQLDTEFRDALTELSNAPMDFYSYKTAALNRLNHALVDHELDLNTPVNVVGLVDYPNNRLYMSRWGVEREYNLDDIDPRYMASLNQVAVVNGKKPERLPITDIAAEMLDKLHPEIDAEMKPGIEEAPITSSRAILERAFANEMVFQVAMEEFIKDNNLDVLYAKDSNKYRDMVSKTTFQASFNDGLKDLSTQVVDTSRELGDER